jgi:hypothetical protein
MIGSQAGCRDRLFYSFKLEVSWPDYSHHGLVTKHRPENPPNDSFLISSAAGSVSR